MGQAHNSIEFRNCKSIILFIYDYKCQLCSFISRTNDVHHIDCNNSNNSLFNLIPLCKNCHKLVHKNKISINISNSPYLLDLLEYFDKKRQKIFH